MISELASLTGKAKVNPYMFGKYSLDRRLHRFCMLEHRLHRRVLFQDPAEMVVDKSLAPEDTLAVLVKYNFPDFTCQTGRSEITDKVREHTKMIHLGRLLVVQ